MHFPRHARSLLALALAAAAAPAHALDLAEAYAKARSNDPNWSAARNSYEAEKATVAIGRGASPTAHREAETAKAHRG